MTINKYTGDYYTDSLFTKEELIDPSITYAKQTLHPRLICTGVAIISVLSIAALTPIAVPFVMSSLINASFIGMTIYLNGLLYGIGNDMIACRTNIEYFTKGHQPQQEHGLVKTDNPNVNATAWGILATHDLAVIAGIIFGITAGISSCCGAPFIPFMLALLPVGTLVFGLAANWYARSKEKELLSNYDEDGARWWSNSFRNGFGYVALPIFAICLLITTVALSGSHLVIPLALLSMKWEIASSVIPAVLVAGFLCHFYHATNKLKDQKETQSLQFMKLYSNEQRNTEYTKLEDSYVRKYTN